MGRIRLTVQTMVEAPRSDRDPGFALVCDRGGRVAMVRRFRVWRLL